MSGDVSSKDEVIARLVEVRGRIGKLRRALTSHREPILALTRPELEAITSSSSAERFAKLRDRLEEAVQAARDSRESVVGSFDVLFASIGQRTNEIMKVLTLVSVLIFPGTLLAGVMGMNFKLGLSAERRRLPGRWSWPCSASPSSRSSSRACETGSDRYRDFLTVTSPDEHRPRRESAPLAPRSAFARYLFAVGGVLRRARGHRGAHCHFQASDEPTYSALRGARLASDAGDGGICLRPSLIGVRRIADLWLFSSRAGTSSPDDRGTARRWLGLAFAIRVLLGALSWRILRLKRRSMVEARSRRIRRFARS